MRKSVIPIAVAIVAALSLPAQAGKYSCNFFNGSGVIHQCDIESGTSSRACQKVYSSSITGTCFVDKAGTADRLQCVYHNPNKSVADLARDAQKGDATLTSEQPGFIAGGVTVGTPAGLLLTAGYQESNTTPLFQVQCVHAP
jgi:hypothetical protein